jgi:hypothetical protein
MPYTYPFELPATIDQAGKPAKWTCAKAGVTNARGSYWGIYGAHAVPLRFDTNTVVGSASASSFGLGILSTEGGWVGGRLRLGIYQANPTTGMPHTKVWDAGVVTGIGLSGPGFYTNGSGTSPVATLASNNLYWLVTHLIAENGSGSAAPGAEYFGNEAVYNSFANAGNEPMFSYGYGSSGDIGINYNVAPTGLYSQEIVDFGWNQSSPWPATLTGTLGGGFFPTSFTPAVFLKVEED